MTVLVLVLLVVREDPLMQLKDRMRKKNKEAIGEVDPAAEASKFEALQQ